MAIIYFVMMMWWRTGVSHSLTICRIIHRLNLCFMTIQQPKLSGNTKLPEICWSSSKCLIFHIIKWPTVLRMEERQSQAGSISRDKEQKENKKLLLNSRLVFLVILWSINFRKIWKSRSFTSFLRFSIVLRPKKKR